MRVVFHLISTGGGAGASRASRYIAEREKDPAREGPGARPLFSQDQDDLSYRKADRVLDPIGGRPEKDDLLHFSVSFEAEDFDKLGDNEKEKQARLKEVIRAGMKGMAEELNVERLTWVGGIHRNSDNPHAHVVMRKDAQEQGTGREKRIGRIRKSLLPHKEFENGAEKIVPGKIGERFLAALERQQALHLGRDQDRERAVQAWEQLCQRNRQRRRESAEREPVDHQGAGQRTSTRAQPEPGRSPPARQDLNRRQVGFSWNESSTTVADDADRYRITLGKRLELSMRLAFTQVWYDRAVDHGETYRFNVLDQSTGKERHISEFDVQRRASARATRVSRGDHDLRDKAIEADLSSHGDTLQQLTEAREAKIAALQKDIASLSGKLVRVNRAVVAAWHSDSEENRTPLIDRQTLSDLQEQSIRLNLPDQVRQLEKLRIALAREHEAPRRNDQEAGKLGAQLNVARADLMAKDRRLENFEASVHLTTYELHGERWSLGALDKQINRRTDDARLVPERAARLDLRSLTRLNYSSANRQRAADEVEHLWFIRAEIVRQIQQRREPLTNERNNAREMVEILEDVNRAERDSRARAGMTLPQPTYAAYQIKSLEASAETLRDPKLLQEVHHWEKIATAADPEINWEGRAHAREIMSGMAVEETRERLQHFLESKRVASLHLGNHRTGTLGEVEARTLTEYLARAIESWPERDHRHAVKLAAKEHHGRLVSDFEKAQDYHGATGELASAAKGREPQFTEKEKINLEIYSERQVDDGLREKYGSLARGETNQAERDTALSQSH